MSSSSFGTAQVIAEKQTNSFRLAIAGGRVFWATRGEALANVPGGLHSVAVTGGAVTHHSTVATYAVKSAQGKLYWSDDAGIHSMSPDGSDPKLVVKAETNPAHDLAIGGGFAWLSLPYGAAYPFARAPLAGGPVEPLPMTATVSVGYLTATDSTVYVEVAASSDPFLFQVPMADPTAASSAVNNVLFAQMAFDAQHLYFATPTGPSRLPLAGGAPEALGSFESVAGVAVEPHAAYVTSDPSNGCLEGAGQVHRIDLDTKEVKLIADGQTCPSGIQIDASGVWWVNAGTTLDATYALNDPETGSLMFAKRL